MDSDRRHVETDVNILTSRKMTNNLLGNTHKKTKGLSLASLLQLRQEEKLFVIFLVIRFAKQMAEKARRHTELTVEMGERREEMTSHAGEGK
ncbi:hypothetical protein GDO78_019031 [Eleutherodactylus coqui]|uniref:Uncharacterized protein n=1 Tax=Eleutherodactylus coqui TaxID=57060 RepID=A0A8J6JUY0_ELECQ|nr:hypothetical protein GDO78_019031 [Eleutherodactylus coqui]